MKTSTPYWDQDVDESMFEELCQGLINFNHISGN